MEQKKYPPPGDAADATRQVEMLMLGISMADTLRTTQAAPEAASKRRTLDDMRRLSQHIKKVPVYTRK